MDSYGQVASLHAQRAKPPNHAQPCLSTYTHSSTADAYFVSEPVKGAEDAKISRLQLQREGPSLFGEGRAAKGFPEKGTLELSPRDEGEVRGESVSL